VCVSNFFHSFQLSHLNDYGLPYFSSQIGDGPFPQESLYILDLRMEKERGKTKKDYLGLDTFNSEASSHRT